VNIEKLYSVSQYNSHTKKSSVWLLPGALTARLSTPGFYTGQRLEFSLGAILQPFFMDICPGRKGKSGLPKGRSLALFFTPGL